ncbi:nitronate monooxygenase [Paeniglutamicibacter antarcticus]|uniref:Propionate 3-nitronate monooxygenase n=1 Tax=Arthrobacter terrae TaxID=2935737 RepID=A0A931CFW8_9MICC|nr:nitronate monooxygenase [Arthrobacter terrae]MBG0737842.1 nitronate monooxygenase [Arthrobacter terrae]
MFTINDLRIPLLAAPMAGGPSTAALVAAAAQAGGLGMLAAGYKTVTAMANEIEVARELSCNRLGVNLFVPAAMPGSAGSSPAGGADRAARVAEYGHVLEAEAQRYAVTLPTPDPADTDGYTEKIAYLLRYPVPLVSFTFGLPQPEIVERLHDVGTHLTLTVTDAAEARAAVARGADSLCVQGPDAGGHRGTHAADRSPGRQSLTALLTELAQLTVLPLIAAGGVGSGADVRKLVAAGASAVQLGTLLLRTPESGAQQTHKDALASGEYTGTSVTRAFSGRAARGLTNRFIREHDGQAPAAYPEVNQLTRPLRAAAARAGDPDGLALWAGTGFRHSRAEPAQRVITELWRDAYPQQPAT